MADLQARIGPKATKLYPNLTWKRPGADPQSPSKNIVKGSHTRQSDEKEDSDASSHERASSPIFSSPTKSRSNLPRPKESSRQPSLLSRMGLDSGVSEDDVLERKEAAVPQSLLPRVGTTEDTPRSSPNIRSTGDSVHVSDPNRCHGTTNSSPQPALPSSSVPDDRHDCISHTNSNSGQSKYSDDLVVKLSTTGLSPQDPLYKPILQDCSNFNHSSSNIREASQTRLEDNSALQKTMAVSNLPPSQGQSFEDGKLVDSEPLPSHQIRDFLLPLVLENAAHRVKEGDNDLTQLTAHSVLSDEVCSSFLDQIKEVRTEMRAHHDKNRSSINPSQVQFTEEPNNSGAAHTSPSSNINQAHRGVMKMEIGPVITGGHIPPNREIVKESGPSQDQLISALSNHSSRDPLSPSISKRSEPGSQHTPSPERRGFHDHDWGRRYSQHRERFDGHRSRSQSQSPSRYSRDQSHHGPFDSSWHMARSCSPLTSGRRRSPPGSSQSTYFRDRALRESPEVIIRGRRSVSPTSANNYNRMPEHRQSLSHDFQRLERSGTPLWDTTDSPRSPVSRRHWCGADEIASPRQRSFTHDCGHKSSRRRRDSYVGIACSGSDLARRSASPRRKQDRQFSVEQALPRTPLPLSPWSATPNPYCQSPSYFEPERRSAPGSLMPKSSFELERLRDWGADHMKSVSPRTGSMSTHLTSLPTGSHHPTPKPMVIDNKDMQENVIEVRTPKMSDNMPKSRLGVLPCHNVPGVWFVKVALGDIGILECSFEVDNVTALSWNLRPANVDLPNKADILRKEKLQLHLCCLSQKNVQCVMDSLKPDATAQDVATAMLTIENHWPTPGHLIIMVNPQDKTKRIWLPDKLESPCLPVCIEDCVIEGQNIVQFIQLSGMSERMFVLFATARPLFDELQDDDEFVLAPLKNTIDGGKEDIVFEQVMISDLE